MSIALPCRFEDPSGGFDRARQSAHDHAIETDLLRGELAARRACLLAPALVERHAFRIDRAAAVVEIGDVAVAHQEDAAPLRQFVDKHGAAIVRLTLFEEGRDAFERIAVMERIDEAVAFHVEMRGERLHVGCVDERLDARHRFRRHAAEIVGPRDGRIERDAFLRQPVDDAHFMQARRADRLCFEQHFARKRARQRAGAEPRRTAIGRETDTRIRHDELGIVGGDDQIARERERKARTRCRAFDRGDDRLGRCAQRADPLGEQVDTFALHRWVLRAVLQQPVQIAAGAEEVVRVRQHDGAHAVVALGRAERLDACGIHVRMQRVAHAGIGKLQHERGVAPAGRSVSNSALI